MASRKYQKFGLRRDRNFSDLSNSTDALNNLLDTLVDSSSSTFISEDLDAIRGSYSVGLTNDQYRRIINSYTKYTNSSGNLVTFYPNVTYKNKLDIFKVFSGEPRLNGGNGLTAKYYQKTNIFENTVGIFSGTPIKTNNFWESGVFNYTEKIVPESVDANGGVEWEGYFIPTSTVQHTFSIDSSAGFTFDFQTEGYVSGIGTYTEISRIGLTTTFSGSGTINTNSITISPSNTKYVAIGQSVSATGIVTGSQVSNYNTSTGVISLSPPTGFTNAVSSNFSGNITFFKTIGQNTSISHQTYVLTEFEKYRIRFRYFIPQSVDASLKQRYIVFSIRYNNLYSLDYDFSEGSKGRFPKFNDNSVLLGGGTIGGITNSDDYVQLKSTKKIDVIYQPKTSVSQIIKSSTTASRTLNTKILSNINTSGIEIGNYVFGTGIPEGTVVNDIVFNDYIVLSQSATSTGTGTYTFIDHRGFVKRGVGSGSGGTFTLTSGDTNNLRSNMIMIGSGVETYTGITTTGDATSFTISPSQTINSGTTVYFYESRGLINNGLSAYCVPTQTKCLTVTTNTPVGSTIIPVSDSTGVGNGWKVQGYQFGSNTLVNGAPTSSTSITLSKPTTGTLIEGSTFTVTNQSGDRSLCCPPTDTSPPFNPTLDGLETVSTAPSLLIRSGDIKFDRLTAGISTSNISSYSPSDNSGSRLSIQTPSGTFRILCD